MTNSALTAKVHAMSGHLLTADDYDVMMGFKRIYQISDYLTENPTYSDVLKGTHGRDIHRTELEQILHYNLEYDVKRLLPFMQRGAKKFIEVIGLEGTISKIKLCLRLIRMGHPEQVFEYKDDFTDFKLPSEINSVDDFIQGLEGTLCYEPLKIFLNRPELQHTFEMETALDSFWADYMLKASDKYLSPDERKPIRKVFGTEFDLSNLSFLIRCKRTFDMTDAEIYSSIIPRYYRLTEATVSKIIKSPSYDAAIEIIAEETPYKAAFSAEDRFIEKRLTEYITRIKKHCYNANAYSILSPLCYIHLRRNEINNIVSIIEGIRYKLDPDTIKDYLIGYEKGGDK